MIRRPPRSTQSRSSAASDVYKRQMLQLLGVSSTFVFVTMQTAMDGVLLPQQRLFPLYVILVATSICSIAVAETVQHGVSALLSPVSYTHLRAHETVLDLVCRLLLEKKNKTPNLICYESWPYYNIK
eukprot:TRINITY_DN31135_c0_g1_i1.p1 TRINITY_DN31135_c0_g1~~TRINITY_DN31135_c0_g1_i1.p1  ORF type:complete len:127 (+),score=54.57 TRINITY_DN31135_c0_g1_i1:84-464(+)